MNKKNILISSCLYGNKVRYDGKHNKINEDLFSKLKEKYNLFYFCPEVEGGLPTPRIPCEIISSEPLKIINKNLEDKTEAFLIGAQKTLQLCLENSISKAILKANSPSCSSKFVYDGSFSGIKIEGFGVTTKLLKENGIEVFDEYEIEKLL